MSNIYLASDHAGFALKEALKQYLSGLGYHMEDMGALVLDPEDDYPDFVRLAAHRVATDEDSRGIILGKSGQGEAMAANRIKGARAAVYYGGNEDIPRLAREHNNANILSLGAGFLSEEEAKRAVDIFLATEFSGESRHLRRIAKLDI
ncbi:MAG: RpiB/LacA/LacB family sugar-phosphate isomerase [Minisyncoccia bacterium]